MLKHCIVARTNVGLREIIIITIIVHKILYINNNRQQSLLVPCRSLTRTNSARVRSR